MPGRLKSVALHDHPQWRDACADVLNEEWARSRTARLHSLQKSSRDLPYCIVLLESGCSQGNNGNDGDYDNNGNDGDNGNHGDQGEGWEVIGHSRLCMVCGRDDACFVESVVIKKCKRGLGLGRKLMEMTEDHALRLGYSTVYLTTHDKQRFYECVGYTYCSPVVSMGSSSKLLSPQMMKALSLSSSGNDTEMESNDTQSERNLPPAVPSNMPPPPALPPNVPSPPALPPNVPPPPALPPNVPPPPALPPNVPPPPALPPNVPPPPALPPNVPPPPALPPNVPPPPALPPNVPSPPAVPISAPPPPPGLVQRMDPSKVSWMRKVLR